MSLAARQGGSTANFAHNVILSIHTLTATHGEQ
jgi:hypothetical protein